MSPEEQAAIQAARERAVMEASAEFLIGALRYDDDMMSRALSHGDSPADYLLGGLVSIATRALSELAAERGSDPESLVRTFAEGESRDLSHLD